VKKKSKLRF